MATISTLASSKEVDIFSDALNHACLIDGCRLAARQGARLHVYRHLDYSHLKQLLDRAVAAKEGGRLLVITESVFSMDGDVADLSVCPLVHSCTCGQHAANTFLFNCSERCRNSALAVANVTGVADQVIAVVLLQQDSRFKCIWRTSVLECWMH
jgi:hypothetical protein